jgi:hypothetical protein
MVQVVLYYAELDSWWSQRPTSACVVSVPSLAAFRERCTVGILGPRGNTPALEF